MLPSLLQLPRSLLRPVLAVAVLSAPLVASAHHGWSGYDDSRPLELHGTIRDSTYEHPHGSIQLETDEKTWHVVLAPPTRMQNRGLARQQLQPGTRATVEGYPHRKNASELRAERITISGKTVELR